MAIRISHPKLRRDFGDRSWALVSANKSRWRAMTARAARDFPTKHRMFDACEASESAVCEPALSDARQGHGDVHDPRWRARTTLLLVVSVGALFWGAFFWLVFG